MDYLEQVSDNIPQILLSKTEKRKRGRKREIKKITPLITATKCAPPVHPLYSDQKEHN